MPSDMNEARCPRPECRGHVDVPPGSFDGSEFTCYACDKPCTLVIYEGGDWRLHYHRPEDDIAELMETTAEDLFKFATQLKNGEGGTVMLASGLTVEEYSFILRGLADLIDPKKED